MAEEAGGGVERDTAEGGLRSLGSDEGGEGEEVGVAEVPAKVWWIERRQ